MDEENKEKTIFVDETVEKEESTENVTDEPVWEEKKYTENGNPYYEGTYQENEKAKKESKPITKRAFILCMILCLVVSTILGSLITTLILTRTENAIVKKVITQTNYDLVKATGSELTIQEIVAKNENSVVAITTESISTDSWFSQYVSSGAGSGVIYSEDGYIITNEHVVEGASTIKVTLQNGTEYDATLVAKDSISDLAVIKIEETNLIPVTFSNMENLCVGDLAVAIGNPLGTLSGTVTEGIVSALEREVVIDSQTMTLIQTSASVNPGNSGGGLFNQYGELIGIVNAKSTETSSGVSVEGIGFAIPADNVKEVVESLIKNGKVLGRPQIGITIVDLTSIAAASQYGVSIPGVYINEVTGKNAIAAGLKAGDMIYRIDGELVEDSSMLVNTISSKKVGDKVVLTIVRDSQIDKMLTITVVLEEKVNE